MTSVPFGASADDTGEFMLGDVLVSVVLLESDGSIDADTEDWTPDHIQSVKNNVRQGLEWWSDLLDQQDSVHSLNFKIDYTFADNPIATGYEPINRRSDDFIYWIEDFFADVDLSNNDSFSKRIRQFNHRQRVAHDTNWAFTIFVVNSDNDSDDRFRTDGSFSLAYAFAGGRFFVMTSERPASTVAHETAHMFWAMDEYSGSKPYDARRGYYNTQNTNAIDGHPDPRSRVRSIMDLQSVGYTRDALSPSAMETIGWKDSDGDGIFDVLDVPLEMSGTGSHDASRNLVKFVGSASAGMLRNRNPSGSGNDMTLNRVSRIQFRIDGGPWNLAQFYDEYQVDFDISIPIGPNTQSVEIRAVDDATGVTSATLQQSIVRVETPVWRNVFFPNDVNGDDQLSPIDALMVINVLNSSGPHPLPTTGAVGGPPYIDVNDDQYVSPADALLVINALNRKPRKAVPAPRSPSIFVSDFVASECDPVHKADDQSPDNDVNINWQPIDSHNDMNCLPIADVTTFDSLFVERATRLLPLAEASLLPNDIDAAFAFESVR